MVREMALRAKAAQAQGALATADRRNEALDRIAALLEENTVEVLAANQADLSAAGGLSAAMTARLSLSEAKVTAMARGVREVAALPDILGEELTAWQRPNGLQIRQVRVPLGVIGMIYEARPNVTVDAAVLCLKAGNAVLLKGGKEAARSNATLGAILRAGLEGVGLPADLVQVLPATREAARELMTAVGAVDVLIPRGGAGLIQTVVAESRVPVIETGAGVCHVYVHEKADLTMAAAIAVNAKTSNPAVCNAAETLLVARAIARDFLPQVGAQLREAGVTIRGCAETRGFLPWAEAAEEHDWAEEYLDLTLAVRVVSGMEEALAHIHTYGTRHTEAIITADSAAAERFQRTVDAAAVYHNASTRFTDGGEFGFGAEIGISTQKLHARGPMGLAALTSYKYLVSGNGQIR